MKYLKKISITLFFVLFSSVALASPSLTVTQTSTPGVISLDPSSPDAPFFLNEIWRRAPGSNWAVLATTYQGYAVNDTVGASGVYEYRTRWYNPSGSLHNKYSGFSSVQTINVSISTPPTNAPSLGLPNTDTDGSFNVNWNSIALATRYELQRSTGNTNSWSLIYNGSLQTRSQSVAEGVYFYRVRGCNSFGCGIWSTVRSITVDFPTATMPPAKPARLFLPSGLIVVVWDAVPQATYYNLQPRYSNTTVYSGPSTNKYFGSSNTESNWKVQACNGAGCSGWTYN